MNEYKILLICIFDTDTRYMSENVSRYKIQDTLTVSKIRMYSVSQKNPPLRGPDIFHFFHKRLRIFNLFFTHLLYVLIHARLQIFYSIIPDFDEVMPY